MLKETEIAKIFDTILEPKLNWSLNTLGLVKKISIDNSIVKLNIHLITKDLEATNKIRHEIESKILAMGATEVSIDIQRVNIPEDGITGVRNIILVGSGKGGVGKSSIALNLAVALGKKYKVGLMDADIYGPSVPRLIGEIPQVEVLSDEFLSPIEKFGIKSMSIGYLIPESKALDWRGQMTSGTVLQFLCKTNWGNLDYLVIDLPPGTGDIPLTILHKVKCDGVVIVTTPSPLALDDVKRSISFFKDRNIPILGSVENMSYLECEKCQHHNHLFSTNDTDTSKELELNSLGNIPVTKSLNQKVNEEPVSCREDCNDSIIFDDIARKIHLLMNKTENDEKKSADTIA